MFFAVLLFFALLCPVDSSASNPEEELKKIQNKIAEEKKKLGEAKKKESSVLNELENVNKKLNRVEIDLIKYRKNLKHTEALIEALNIQIEKIKENIKQQQSWIQRKLRIMQRIGYGGDAVIQLMNAQDMSQMMRFWKYLEYLTRRDHEIMKIYKQNVAELDEQNRKLGGLRITLKGQEEKVKSKEAELSEQKKGKEAILSSVRSQKAAHQKMLSELNEASRRMQEIIRESSKKDDYEGKGFNQLKGKLLWPAEGKIAISYGTHKDPQFDTPVFRNGLHIQTDPTEEARAVYAGKVIFADWFKGFGQLIIINHGGGYHTLYGNLSEIFSRVGDIIKDRQVIGKVGTSGTLNAPGLYFEIRYKGKPLDPSQWLKRKR